MFQPDVVPFSRATSELISATVLYQTSQVTSALSDILETVTILMFANDL